MKLRGYQEEAVAAILTRFAVDQRTLCVLPTGGGKTIVAGDVAKAMLSTGRIMVLAHRDELIRQAAEKFSSITGIVPGIEKADQQVYEDSIYETDRIVIASVQSLVPSVDGPCPRLQKFSPEEFSLLCVDEAHHATADTYQKVISHFCRNERLKVLGLTATPDRADEIPMGEVFESVAYVYELPAIIKDGYLVPLEIRRIWIDGLDFSKVATRGDDFAQGELEAAMLLEKPLHGVVHAAIEQACGLQQNTLDALRDAPDRIEALQQLLNDRQPRKTLLFSVGVEQARLYADIINRWLPGSAVTLNGMTPGQDRRSILRRFRNGEVRFLTNCMVATEGFDEPSIELIVLARPTKSRALCSQMIGRGTRPSQSIAHELGECEDSARRREMIAQSDKPKIHVLDFAGNCGRHKLVGPADILGQQYPQEVIDKATEMSREEEIDASKALERAEKIVLDEQAEAAQAAEKRANEIEKRDAECSRRNLVGTSRYHIESVDPFNHSDVSPLTGLASGGATAGQVHFLVKLGVMRETAVAYSKRQASAVIESLKKKRCTIGQRSTLARAAYSSAEIDGMNFDAASSEIDRLAQNGWKREVT